MCASSGIRYRAGLPRGAPERDRDGLPAREPAPRARLREPLLRGVPLAVRRAVRRAHALGARAAAATRTRRRIHTDAAGRRDAARVREPRQVARELRPVGLRLRRRTGLHGAVAGVERGHVAERARGRQRAARLPQRHPPDPARPVQRGARLVLLYIRTLQSTIYR